VNIPIAFVGWLLLLLPASLLVLSYALYHGRDWARRAVVVVGVCLSILAIIGFAMRAVAESRIYDAHVITGEMRVQQALGALGQVGLALCVVAPQLFVICVLCHRDIVATFRQR
jgi:glucose uptake protein GlcU